MKERVSTQNYKISVEYNHVKAVSMRMPEGFSRVELLEPYSRREPREISAQELCSIPVQPGCPYFLLRFHPAR